MSGRRSTTIEERQESDNATGRRKMYQTRHVATDGLSPGERALRLPEFETLMHGPRLRCGCRPRHLTTAGRCPHGSVLDADRISGDPGGAATRPISNSNPK
jgi:hypothetical protein